MQRIGKHHLEVGKPWLLRVNIRNRPLGEIKAPRVCRLGRRHAAERVIVQQSPRGDTMYWIGNAGAAKDDAEGTDFHATLLGHVAVTPLKVDLTDHQNLGYWAQTAARMVEGTGAGPQAAQAAAVPAAPSTHPAPSATPAGTP